MPAKLFDEAQPVDVFLGRMVQHMQLYEATPKVSMVVSRTVTHPEELISGGFRQRRGIRNG